MNIASLLALDRVEVDVRAAGKKQLLEHASRLFARHCDIAAQDIFEVLNQRERLGSTGIGHGVAFPHGRLDKLHTPLALFLRCAAPVEFAAIDGQPVSLVFAFLIGSERTEEHLRLLANLATVFGDARMRTRLHHADTDRAVFDLLASAFSANSTGHRTL